mgnify:CR=1 FL=1
MRLLLRLIKSKKANKKTPSHGESVHDRGISFCVKKLEVGEGQKHRFGAVSEPVQNERNKIKILLRSMWICDIIMTSIKFTGGSYAAIP